MNPDLRGVPFGRRSPLQRGPFSTPNHTQEIARSVQEVSISTREVSSNMTGVHHSAKEAGIASSDLLTTAATVARSGEALRAQVDGFLRDLRAA